MIPEQNDLFSTLSPLRRLRHKRTQEDEDDTEDDDPCDVGTPTHPCRNQVPPILRPDRLDEPGSQQPHSPLQEGEDRQQEIFPLPSSTEACRC